jgi:FkbM family methyltransferase
MLNIYPDAAFLDVGSNIGIFVIMAATMGRSVYTVEPVISNLAFISASAKLVNTQKNITMINNAVSDENTVLIPWTKDSGNEANVLMYTDEQFRKLSKEDQKRVDTPIKTVTLDQVLDQIHEETVVIKIDVEGFECKVLNHYFKSHNKKHFVPYIAIEWAWIEVDEIGTCPPDQLDLLIQNFESAGYKPFFEGPVKKVRQITNAELHSGLKKNMGKDNVVWIHDKALHKMKNLKEVV